MSAIAFSVLLVGVLRIGATARGADGRLDFSHYYVTAQYFNEGLNPYTTPLAPRMHELGFPMDERIPIGAHPPLLVRLFSPLAMLPPGQALGVWLALQSACLAGLVIVIGRIVGAEANKALFLAMAAVLVNSTAVSTHFYYSQVQLLVAVMIASALWLHVQGHASGAMAVAVLAAAFKLYPAVLLPWFLLAGLAGPRDFAMRIAAGGATALAILLGVGTDPWLSFLHDGLPIIQLSVGASWTNYSLPSLAKMLSGSIAGDLANPPAWSGMLGKLAGLASIAAAYAFIAWKRARPGVAVSLLVLAMMSASLVCWSHYFVLAALPAAVLVFGSREEPWPRFAWCALLAGLLVTPQLDATLRIFQPLPLRVLIHFYPLAVMGLVACELGRLRNEPAGSAAVVDPAA